MKIHGKNRFLIIGKTRSGTTVLHLALIGHPNATGFSGELQTDPLFTKGITNYCQGYANELEKHMGYSALFDTISLIRANEDTKAHGCKLATNSIANAEIIVNTAQQHVPDLKIIIIQREDLVANFGSSIVGSKTGIMHSWSKGYENRKVKKIHINKWLFTNYVLSSLRFYDELKKLIRTHDVLQIRYEDILTDPQQVYNKVFEFLDLPQVEVTWNPSKKVLPKPEQYITNYSKMTSYLHELKNQYQNNNAPPHIIYLGKIAGKFNSFLKKK